MRLRLNKESSAIERCQTRPVLAAAQPSPETLLELLFDQITSSSRIKPGSMLSLDRNGVLFKGSDLRNEGTDAPIRVSLCDERTAVRISVELTQYSYYSAHNACRDNGVALCIADDMMIGFSDLPLTEFGTVGELIERILIESQYLDSATAFAAAYDMDARYERIPEFDVLGCIGSYGYGTDGRSRWNESFKKDCEFPSDSAIAAYCIPFNLHVCDEAGILHVVMEEANNDHFSLWNLASGRWFFGTEVIRFLQHASFSDGQIAYIVLHDEGIGELMCSRDYAERCSLIERTSFNPEDELQWGDYLASQTGPIQGFL